MPPLSPLTHEVRGVPIIYCAILCIALNPQSGDFSGAILGVRSVALLHGKIRQGIRKGKEMPILIKSWEFFGRSLVRPWFLLGLLHDVHIQGTREGNLNNRTFFIAANYSCF